MMTRTIHFRLVLLVVAVMLVLRAVPAQAADVLVTEATDNAGTADVSLREAIGLANPGDRVIVTTTPNLTLDAEIVVNKNITIDLGGKSVTATGNHRIFNITNTVTLQNGTLIGSGAQLPANGGLIIAAGTLNLEDITLQGGNVAQQGGALHMGSGPLTADNLTVTGNTAGAGGGLYVDATASAVLQRSTVQNNTLASTTDNIRRGAGIYAANYLVLTNSTVSGNAGAYLGGGVYSIGNTLIINGSVIQSNTANVNADGNDASGGGVYLAGGGNIAYIGQTGINGNNATRGGGLFVDGRLDLFNATVDSNTTTGIGGGVLVSAVGQLTSSFATVSNNTANPNTQSGVHTLGGAVFLKNSLLSNTGNGNCSASAGTFTDETGNLDSGSSCGFGANSLSSTTPGLGGLGGGVRILAGGSAAIDAVTDCTVSAQARNSALVAQFGGPAYPGLATVDQRNAPRPGGAACDIGAYESPAATAPSVIQTVVKSITLPEDQSDFATFSVVLTSQPSAGNVVVVEATPDIELEIENEGGQRFLPAQTLQLTFDEFNWAQPQRVQVFARQDTDPESSPHTGRVTLAIGAATTDVAYNPVTIAPLDFNVFDDDQVRTVSINNLSVNENAGVINFTVTLDDTADVLTAGESVTVAYSTSDVTTTAGVDYITTNGTLIFQPGGPKTLPVPVEIIDDTVAEGLESFNVQLSLVNDARIVGTGVGIGTITDNDGIVVNTLTVLPESIPTGRVGEAYSTTFTGSGGTPPYTFFISTDTPFPGDDWEFDESTGELTGTPAAVATTTFTITVTDTNGEVGSREYTVEFTLTGEPSDGSGDGTGDDTVQPTATPISPAEVEATNVANIRANLGPPRLQIDPETDIPSIYIRSGPAVGATIINLAQLGTEYNIVGIYRPPGGGAPWYLIEYDRFPDLIPGNDGEIGPDGATVTPTPKERGWVAADFLLVAGYVLDIPVVGNPFDNVSLSGTGVRATTTHKNNLYQYPTPNSGIILQMDEGTGFEILGRTNVDQRDIPNWLLVRFDNGRVGWIKWTPFIVIDGSLNRTRLY
jgi:hypothetical protein